MMQGRDAVGTILSIEDDQTTINILRIFLERCGYVFYGANSAVDGLEMAHEMQPDVIIMDLLMPEVSGWEAIEILKRDRDISHIPIIVLSALSNADAKRRAFEAGCDVYLSKPIRFDELKDYIDLVCAFSAAA